MEFSFNFEMNLIWSKRKKLEKYILRKYLRQFQKIFNSLRKDYFEQLYFPRREIPPGEKRYFPISSTYILLYKFINISGFILVTIDGEEEKKFIDSLNKFLEIQNILNKIIFETHPNYLKKFDRKKNIKVEIYLEGIREFRPLF